MSADLANPACATDCGFYTACQAAWSSSFCDWERFVSNVSFICFKIPRALRLRSACLRVAIFKFPANTARTFLGEPARIPTDFANLGRHVYKQLVVCSQAFLSMSILLIQKEIRAKTSGL